MSDRTNYLSLLGGLFASAFGLWYLILYLFPVMESIFPVLLNFYISAMYASLAWVMKGRNDDLKMFLGGCSLIHLELGLHNLTGAVSHFHQESHMIAFDLLQIVGGTSYLVRVYYNRALSIRLSFGRESNGADRFGGLE